ncbi:MAG TPA: polynucleotide adenylyltransferase PcnB [Anaeromyxobacteraceae bacterium]|nr:polynucleotide adenylyltransferase PcnB [Anaeromyxobacteraceae bacterium]
MHDRSFDDSPRPKHPKHGNDEQRPHRGPPPGLALDPPDFTPAHEPEIPVERLDPDALRTIARLRHMGHQAFFVGGCVRDLLLDEKPKDFDVATDAHPGEVRAVFRNCRLIGRRFRLAHVYFRGGKVIEVATFRKNPTELGEEGADEDADLLITRDNVFGTAEEDAVRRDFTVNGLFYDPATGEVIDYVGGREDLEARRIATIGDPEIRMREDPVRALRAIRFASRHGFTIAPDTFEAMRRHAGELARCAPPRVLEETFKILRCGGSARAFELLRASNALPHVLPSLSTALDRAVDGQRRSFFQHLAALDRLVRGGEEVSEAVLLGALLMHLHGGERAAAPAAEGAEPAPATSDEANRLLELLVQTSRLPRKVAERTRLALQAQRLLREPAKKRRRRGRGLAGQSHFTDALQLLEITVGATGEGRELLDRWAGEGGAEREPRERPRPLTAPGGEPVAPFEAAEAEEEEAEAEAQGELTLDLSGGEPPAGDDRPARPDGAPGRRRRRRGGRRRRRRGAAGGAAGGADAGSAPDAGGEGAGSPP